MLPDGSPTADPHVLAPSSGEMMSTTTSPNSGGARISSPDREATRLASPPRGPRSASSGVHTGYVHAGGAGGGSTVEYHPLHRSHRRSITSGLPHLRMGASDTRRESPPRRGDRAGLWRNNAAKLAIAHQVGHAADSIIPGDIRLTTHLGRPAIVQDVAPDAVQGLHQGGCQGASNAVVIDSLRDRAPS